MNRLCLAVFSMLLVAIMLATGLAGTSSVASVEASKATSVCKLDSLPADIQNSLAKDFSSWKVQEPENLSDHARRTWSGKKSTGCPGIAVGLFQNTKTLSYAVLLFPVDHPDAGYTFVVFSRKTGHPDYKATVVEQSSDARASSYFIRKVTTSAFFDQESKAKFQVQANDAILMVTSAEDKYEADLYFWSNGRFSREPVDG